MKICFVTSEYPPFPGGIATYVAQAAEAAHLLGHNVTVLVFGGQGGALPTSVTNLSVIMVDKGKYSPFRLPVLAVLLRAQVSYRDSDMLVACDIRCAIIMNLARPQHFQRSIAVLHGTELVARLLTTIHKLPIFRPLELFDRIVTNSEFTKNLALSTVRYLSEERVKASPLGVNRAKFDPPQKDEIGNLRRRWLGDERDILIISVGRQERRKGFEYAIDAVSALPDSIKARVSYKIIGKKISSEYGDILQRKSANSNADVSMVGVLDSNSLNTAFWAADIFVHPAVNEPRSVEGFGLVLLEASAAKCAILSSLVDAIPEVVDNGVTGLLAEPRDIQALRSGLEKLISDTNVREEMQNNAQEFARNFTWERHLDAFFN